MSKKCTPLWREAHCGSEQCKKLTVSDCFWKLGCGFAWHAQGIRHLAKSEQNVRVCCSSFKSVGRRGAFEEDLQDGFCEAGAVQETCSSEMLGGQGGDFLRKVAFWSVRSSGVPR